MKLINFIYKTVFLVALALCATQCKDKDNDNSQPLTMTLYDQPLSTIQSVVERKWKWYSDNLPIGVTINTNPPAFVNFKQDSYDIIHKDGSIRTFSYRWEQKETLTGYATYVMWEDKQNIGIWYFESIKNDTLLLHSFDPLFDYIFIRIK